MTTVPGVSNNELVRTTWGNTVATELNTRTVKITGVAENGAVISGSLIVKYDAGAAMRLRRAAENPYIQFENSTGATPFGTIQGAALSMILNIDNVAGVYSFRTNNVAVASIDSGGITIASGKSLDAPGSQLRGQQGRFGNAAGATTPQLLVIDTNGGAAAANANVSFYPSATSLDATGSRGAYVGYDGAGFQVQASAETIVSSTAADVKIDGQTDIRFVTVDTERMRLAGSVLLFGKTADDNTTAGVSIYGTGSTAEGSVRSVTGATAAGMNFFGKHVGAADAENQAFLVCQRASGTPVATILQGDGNNSVFNAGPGGGHTTTSDYRLKNDLGPVVDPVGRVMALAPRHRQWNELAGTVGEFDGFLAHEVQAVAPEAVDGAKDAVWPEDSPLAGEIKAQGLDTSKLVPLLTAALQDALTTIADLTARVEALEAV